MIGFNIPIFQYDQSTSQQGWQFPGKYQKVLVNT